MDDAVKRLVDRVLADLAELEQAAGVYGYDWLEMAAGVSAQNIQAAAEGES